MSVDGQEAEAGDLGEVERQPEDVNNPNEGLGGDDSEMGMTDGSGEHQQDDGEDGKIIEGQYDDYTTGNGEEEDDDESPTKDEIHNSHHTSSMGQAQLSGG